MPSALAAKNCPSSGCGYQSSASVTGMSFLSWARQAVTTAQRQANSKRRFMASSSGRMRCAMLAGMRTLINNLEFVLTLDAKNSVLRDAAVVVEDDRIADIGPAAQISKRSGSVDSVID